MSEWSRWARAALSEDQREVLRSVGSAVPDHVYVNSLYEVWVHENAGGPGFPRLTWLSIKRRDKEPVHDWRHLQRIKSELVGRENEGVELYPAESRHVDGANQYHLWVLAEKGVRFPFGFSGRSVIGPVGNGLTRRLAPAAKQRPFDLTHPPPDVA